ncbi:MAG: hypothetical protein KBD16_00325 [Candidatus Pacebacteria bacterium]|nr:hypothetical protein [Candidatus Paceibacterota bacterium]
MNVYLKVDETLECEHFSKAQERGASGQTNFTFFLHGQYIFREKGPWYLVWTETEPIPDWLEPLIDKVSLYVAFPFASHRETGVYRHETAKAELDTRPASRGQREYRVEIRGTKVADVFELLRRIRIGTIRPEQSFEGPQGGLSRQELEERLQYTEREIARLQTRVDQNAAWRQELRSALEWFREGLKGSNPFVRRGTVRQRVSNILAVHFKD